MPGEQVGSAFAKIGLDSRDLESGMNASRSKFSSFASDMEGRASKLGSAISGALKTGLMAMGAAVVGASTLSVKSFADFEQGMANVSKMVDGTREQIDALGESLRGQAVSTGIAVSSLQQVASTLGALGVKYEDIASTTELIAKGSKAFGMEADTMATQVAKISTVYGIPITESERFLSAMNALGNATAATEPQILQFTQALGPIATQFKVPIEKVAAFGATLISSGIDAEEGATSIRSAIEYAMAGAKGTRMESWAKLLGTDVKSLNQMLNTDFLGTMAKSSAALNNISSSTEKSKAAFDIWGSYGFKVMGTMSTQAGNLDKNMKVVTDDIASGSRSMGQEFERQTNTIWGAFDKAKAGLNDVGISIGKVTSGPFKNLLDWFNKAQPEIKKFFEALVGGDINKLKSQFSGLANAAQTAFKLIAGAAGVGLVIKGLSMISPAIGPITGALVGMGKAAVVQFGIMTNAALVAKLGFISTWAAALGPIAAVVGGVALVAAGLAAIGYSLNPGKFTIFGKAASDAFNGIKSVVTDVWGLIQAGDWAGVADRLKQAFGDAISFLKGLDWKGLGSEVITMAADGAKAIIDTAFKLGDWIHDTIETWINAGGPRQLGRNIADVIGGAINAFLGSETEFNPWEALKSAFGTVKDWLSMGWEIIKGIGQGLLDRIYAAAQPAANKLLASFATTSFEIQGTFARAWNTILIGVANLVDGIKRAFSGIGEYIATQLQPGLEAAARAATYVGNAPNAVTSGWVEKATGKLKSEGSISTTEKESGEYRPATLGDIYAATPRRWEDMSQPTFAGYRTGGRGFVSSELQPATGGNLQMTTNLGDLVTLTGKETLSKSTFDFLAPYTADYITNTKEAGQAWADKVMPVAEEFEKVGEKNTNKQNRATQALVDGLHKSKGDLGQGIFESSWVWQEGVASSVSTLKDGMASSATKLSNSFGDASDYAKTAMSLGGDAVRIGLDASGRQIAIIGQVAQTNFTKAGGKWVYDAGVAGQGFVGSVNAANISHQDTAKKIGIVDLENAKAEAKLRVGAANEAGAIQIGSASSFGAGVSAAGEVHYKDVTSASSQVKSDGISLANNFATAAGTMQGFTTTLGKFLGLNLASSPSDYINANIGGGGGGASYVNSKQANITGTQTVSMDNIEDGVDCVCGEAYINAVIASTGPLATAGLGIALNKGYNPVTGQFVGHGTESYSGVTYSYSGGGISSKGGGYSSASKGMNTYASGYSGGYYLGSSYMGPAWGAKGADITSPMAIIAGERGEELLLPPDLTARIKSMTAPSGGDITIPITVELDGKVISRQVMKVSKKQMELKGFSK